MRKNRNMYVLIIFVVALLFGIGYAVLNSDLNIAGSTKIKDNIWDVHFENINVTTGSVSPASPSDAPTIQNGTNVTYTITLDQPGDFFEFTVDTKNSGTINALISSVANSGLTTEQKKYIDYSATYDSSASIAENQKLNAGKREVIRVKVGFKKDIDASDLPATDKVLNLTFSINYEQATSSAVAIAHPKCKRATTLHKETCSVSGTDGCKAVPTDAETITYGNRGTKGTSLSEKSMEDAKKAKKGISGNGRATEQNADDIEHLKMGKIIRTTSVGTIEVSLNPDVHGNVDLTTLFEGFE